MVALKYLRWCAVLAAALLFFSLCATDSVRGQPLPGQPGSMTVTAYPPLISINGSNATIIATVYDEYGNLSPNGGVYFNNSETNLGTLSGGSYINVSWEGGSYTWEWYNTTNATGVATITLTSRNLTGTERVRVWVGGHRGEPNLDKTVTVNFTAQDLAPPSVTNPSANPVTILNDNGRPRAAGTNRTQINVTVTDDAGVASVTINLSAIGGSATQPMTKLAGTNVWTVTTNATAGINATHALTVNATDLYGKVNNTVKVALEVRLRGDVVRDSVVDLKDALYIARYTVWLEPEFSNPPAALIADVVGAAGDPRGDSKVDMKDVLYLAKWVVGQEQAP
jgi:hypothetical protein